MVSQFTCADYSETTNLNYLPLIFQSEPALWHCERDLLTYVPLLHRLYHYKLRWIVKDFFAGIVVACFHIPQSMGTGMACNLNPMYGIYMTFFPALIYAFFGSSYHNSVGAFAPTAALVGVGAARIRTSGNLGNLTGLLVSSKDVLPLHLEAAVAITFLAGLVQVALSFCKLGFLSRLFSHNVLDPFNCACSLQIMLVQIPNMLGVPLIGYYGLYKHIKMLILLFASITDIRWADTLFSVLSASVIIGFREFVQPALFKHIRIVLPIEFIVMVVAIILSYCFEMHENYGIIILGDMPIGIPSPRMPQFRNMPFPVLEGFLSALVSIAFAMQAAKVLTRKCDYQVSTNQDLFAIGASNVFSSFFSCFVASSAVGRNLVAESMGAHSQLSALFGCLLTGLLLAFASQTLYYLPFSVIATIITLTLAMTLKMFWDLPRIYKACKLDAFAWILTFVACVILDVEWGLIIGLGISWFGVIYRDEKPRIRTLGKSSNFEGMYLPLKEDRTAREIAGIRIFQMTNSLHFFNAEHFLQKVTRTAAMPSYGNELEGTKEPFSDLLQQNCQPITSSPEARSRNSIFVIDAFDKLRSVRNGRGQPTNAVNPQYLSKIHCVILDFSGVESIDSIGLRALQQLATSMAKKEISLYISGCRAKHLRQFELDDFFQLVPKERIVPHIQVAVDKATIEHRSEVLKPVHTADSTVTDTEEPTTFWDVQGAPVEGLETGETYETHIDDDD